MVTMVIYADVVIVFIATMFAALALRNVHKIEYNLQKDELAYRFADDKFLTRTMLRAKVWCLFGLDLCVLLSLGGRVVMQLTFPVLYLTFFSLLICLLLLLLSLIFHLIYAKKELNFLRITKVTDEGLLA